MAYEGAPVNPVPVEPDKEHSASLTKQMKEALEKLVKQHGETSKQDALEEEGEDREPPPEIPSYLRSHEDTSFEARFLRRWVEDSVVRYVSTWKFEDFAKFMKDKGRMARGVYALGLPTSNVGPASSRDSKPQKLAAKRATMREGWRNTVQHEFYVAFRTLMWELVRGRYHVVHEVTPGKVRVDNTHDDSHVLSEILHAMLRAEEPVQGETGMTREQKLEIVDMLVHSVQEEVAVLEESLAPGWEALAPADESDQFNIGFLDRARIGKLSVPERAERMYQMIHLAKELNAVVDTTLDGAGRPLINNRIRLPENISVSRSDFAVIMNEFGFDLGFMSGMARYVGREFSLQKSQGVAKLDSEGIKDLAEHKKAFLKAAEALPDIHILDSLNRLAQTGLLPLYNEHNEITALLKARKDVDPAYLSELAQQSLNISPAVRQERSSPKDALDDAGALATKWETIASESGPAAATAKKNATAELKKYFAIHAKNDSIKLLAESLELFKSGPDIGKIVAPIIEKRLASLASINLRSALIETRELRKMGYDALITDKAIQALGLRAKDLVEEMLVRTSSQDTYLFFRELLASGLGEFVLTEKAASLWTERILAHDIEFSRTEVLKEELQLGS
ncbi:MAG TPA: hypothetical protein PK109_00305 [Candidatus Paceibacterota bacterium]|nr:hypothetical protein [Candidatus Paceibacterota bacterium]